MIKAEDNITLRSDKIIYDIAANTDQYFWHTETGEDTGAHITEIPKEDFLDDPENGGGNLLARSNGIAVRNGLEELASFGANGARIGQDGANRVELNSESIALITNNNEDALRSEVSGTTVKGGVPIQTFGNSIPSDTTMTFDLNLNDVQDGETFWVRVRTLISHARVQYATHGGKAARTMYTTATTESVAVAFTKAQSGTETKSVTMKFPKEYTLTSDYSSNIELTDYYNFTPTLVYDAANSTVQITAPTYPATRLVARTRQHTEIVDGTSYSFLIGVLRTTENRCSFALQRIEAEQTKYLPKTQINGRTYLALNADLDIPDVYDQAVKDAITGMGWNTDCIENGQLNLKALLYKLLGGASETDTDGIWTIRKWADGTAECWGTHTGTYNLTQSYGGAYYASEVSVNFPSSFFTGEPTVTVARQGRQGQGLISISPYSVTASKVTMFIFNIGMALSNEPLGISIHAIGRWK